MRCSRPYVAIWYKSEYASSKPLSSDQSWLPDFVLDKPRLLQSAYAKDLDKLRTPSNILHITDWRANIIDQYCQFVVLPCGKCDLCALHRASEWSFRNYAEFCANDCIGMFLTLTFDDAHIDSQLDKVGDLYSLDYRPLQLFLKRLRKECGQFRYFVCGEYGSIGHRPHYHCLIYGLTFDDLVLWSVRNDVGYYRSATLEKLWPFGNSLVGAITPESIQYVSRYCVKKLDGWSRDHDLSREFTKMSLKPAIGKAYYDRFFGVDFSVVGKDGTVSRDYVNFNGRKLRPPRYYDKCAEREHNGHYATLKNWRNQSSMPFDLGCDDLIREDRYIHLICTRGKKTGVNNV